MSAGSLFFLLGLLPPLRLSVVRWLVGGRGWRVLLCCHSPERFFLRECSLLHKMQHGDDSMHTLGALERWRLFLMVA